MKSRGGIGSFLCAIPSIQNSFHSLAWMPIGNKHVKGLCQIHRVPLSPSFIRVYVCILTAFLNVRNSVCKALISSSAFPVPVMKHKLFNRNQPRGPGHHSLFLHFFFYVYFFFFLLPRQRGRVFSAVPILLLFVHTSRYRLKKSNMKKKKIIKVDEKKNSYFFYVWKIFRNSIFFLFLLH